MRRIAKVAAWAAGVLFLLVGLTVAGGWLFLTSDWVHKQLESRAAAWSGRETRIGKVTIEWGSVTRVHLADVQVANSDWGKAPHMLKAEEADFTIRPWSLLKGDVVLPHVTLRRPEVYLERNDKDQTNWDFDQSPVIVGAAKTVAPKERFQAPLIGRLEIVEGKIGYSDLKRRLDLDGTVTTALGHAGGQTEARLRLKGKLENQPLTVRFVGGSAVLLRETDQPYPVDLAIDYGGTKLALKGTLDDPLQWKGADVQLALSGPNLSEIYPLLGIPGPNTGPYRITGRLDRDGDLWKLTQSSWHVGDSDLTGDVTVDNRPKVSKLTANLVSPKLVFADLAPLIGASPGRHANLSAQQRRTEAELQARGDLFPNVPLHVERLRAMDMDVTLDAKHIIAPPYLPVTALSFRFLDTGGVAAIKPLAIALAGGSITGELGIDARNDMPKVRMSLLGKDLDFGAFFHNTRYFDTTQGKIQTRVDLQGAGKSLAQVMGGADGRVDLAMAGGSISDLLVSLAGLQIADALILYISDHRIPINCALGRLNFKEGTASFERTLLDTRKSVLHVGGWVSLSQQTVGMKVDADPKKFDLLDLNGPVLVQGKIRDPKVSIQHIIPIPHPVIGTAKDVACQQLTGELLTGK